MANLLVSVSEIEVVSESATYGASNVTYGSANGTYNGGGINPNITIGNFIGINENEAITEGELVTINITSPTLQISVSDVEVVSESSGTYGSSNITYGSATTNYNGSGGNPLIVIAGFFDISVSDTETESELVTIQIPQEGAIFVSDTQTEGELVTIQLITSLIVSDSETELESVTVAIPTLGAINVIDSDTSQITFDAASAWTTGASVSSISFNHTIGTGQNRMLFVLSLTTNNDASATYNGVSMTKALVQVGGDGRYISLFALPNPTSGTHSVVISGTGTEIVLQGGGASYFGVAQNTTFNATTTNTSGVSTPLSFTTTVTTTANNDWIILGARTNSGGVGAGTNTTFRSNSVFTALADNNGAVTPPGPYSMSVTGDGTGGFYSVMVAIQPAPVLDIPNIEQVYNISVSDAETENDVVSTEIVEQIFVSDVESENELVTVKIPLLGSIVIDEIENETEFPIIVIKTAQILSFSIYDMQAENELVTVSVPNLGVINISDSETENDTVADIQITNYISVSDAEIVGDAVVRVAVPLLLVNASDIEAEGELVAVAISVLPVVTADTVTELESVAIIIPEEGGIFVTDAETVRESVSVGIVSTIRNVGTFTLISLYGQEVPLYQYNRTFSIVWNDELP